MIKNLRKKFIFVAMLSVTLVLVAIMATVNVVNYVNIAKSKDSVVSFLCDNNGEFPQNVKGDGRGGSVPPQKPDGNFSPEMPFETRYFSVRLDKDGNVTYSDVKNIAAITEENAEEYAKNLFSKNATKGFVGNYRYGRVEKGGETLYVFVDSTRDLDTFGSFLSMSVFISVAGLLLVFVLVVIFSKAVFKPVEESYKKQKSFITNAGHDLKTPLTIIGADAEVIELENGASEWTDDIKKQISRLSSLTEKLVFLAKMDERETPLQRSEVNLSEMLAETVASYDALALSKNLKLEINAEKDVLYNGNEETLRQAIALLLDNAVKYAKSEIKVSVKKLGGGALMEFSNDVENIEKGNHDEFFERFYKGDDSRNSSGGGHGIGLSVVRSIVEAHKGKITAESPDNHTVVFKITL